MKRILVFIFNFYLTFSLFSQSEVDKVLSTVHMNGVKGHLTFIASDELEGRDVGSRGIETAAMYLKTQLMSYGVAISPGMDSYFQKVPLSAIDPPEKGSLVVGENTFSFPNDFVILGGENISGKAEFVFSELKEEEDYKKKKVADKIVISICGDGTTTNPQSWFYQAEEKINKLKAVGAIGLIELYQSNQVPFKFLKQKFAKKQIILKKQNTQPFLHLWINAAEKTKIASLKGKGQIGLDITVPDQEQIPGKNVVGYVEGSDPDLKSEYIVYSAHYDHVGVGNANAQQDSIYNGARDNGVGTTAILEVARNISKYPTRRSALFVFFTAEEKGLLGSRFFVDNPPIDLKDIVYNFNIDNGGYNDTTIISVVGLDRTTAGKNIRESCEIFGLEGIEVPAKDQGLFDRSDNVNFAKKGIPAPTFSLGFTAFDAEIYKYYHQPTDEVESLDFHYLLKYFRAYVLASRKIANDDIRPFWIKGDKYYEAGKNLYEK